MRLHLHHIAILVRSVEATETTLPPCLGRLPVETFPGEGTKEQYLDLDPAGRTSLLLIEAMGEGPYRQTFSKRGPGLHHFGCMTNNLEEAVDHFGSQRLFLHPISQRTLKQNVAWMCRPGIPFLLEIVETPNLDSTAGPLLGISIPRLDAALPVHLPRLTMSPTDDDFVTITTDALSFQL